jgi:hypothetical protein
VLLLLGRRKSFFIPSFQAFCSEHILLKIKLIRYCELEKVIEKKKKEQIGKEEREIAKKGPRKGNENNL